MEKQNRCETVAVPRRGLCADPAGLCASAGGLGVGRHTMPGMERVFLAVVASRSCLHQPLQVGLGARRNIPLCGAVVSTCIVAEPERVSADVSAQEAAQTFVQTVAENKDFLVSSAGFGVSVASTFWTYRQVQEAERATAETKRQTAEAERATAEAKQQTAEAKRQAEALKQSDEYKVQRAVAKFMDPFVPKMPKRKVIHRKVMDTIANRVKTWDEHATIVSGRFRTGKTVAVEEVLRGARGIFKHTVKDEHWEERLYKSLQVDGPGMFEAVLVRVKAELAKLADPITKTPIILFEVPRATTKGRGQNLTTIAPQAH